MALQRSVGLALLFSTVAQAQSIAQRINVTANDGALTLEWAIPTVDNSIATFEGKIA